MTIYQTLKARESELKHELTQPHTEEEFRLLKLELEQTEEGIVLMHLSGAAH